MNGRRMISYRPSSGYSLVELMVGLFVSILVGGVAMTFLLTSSKIMSTQNAEDIVQENARFALELLASSIRLAGSNTSTNVQTQTLSQGIFRDAICSNNDCNQNNTLFETGTTGLNAISSRTDVAAFEHITDTGRTCNGVDITSERQIVHVYYVDDADNDGVASLYCEAYESEIDYITQDFDSHVSLGAVPLIDGVEMLQVQYGIDEDGTTDGTIDRYKSYNNIAADEFDDIKAIRLGLILSNVQEEFDNLAVTEVPQARTVTILDGALTATDGIFRQAVSTTVFLPNSSAE